MTRILTSDFLIADVIVRLEGNPKLAALAAAYGLAPGGKAALSREMFGEITAAIDGHAMTIMPGGSSANMLATLKKLLGAGVEVDFIGIIGDGLSSNMIRHSLAESGIRLLPETLPPGIPPKTAMSYVLIFADGQRTIATWPGNARDILKPALIDVAAVRSSDALLVPGSLWQKLDWDFADRLVELRWQEGRELWLALPTHPNYGEERAGHFQWLAARANLVLGNGEELSRLYRVAPEQALLSLQADFRKKVLEEKKTQGEWKGGTGQIGFITLADLGAAVVTADAIERVDSLPVAASEVANTLGAGDTAFAGFAAGYLRGLSHKESAALGMALAGEKLKVNAARLPDPLAALRRTLPGLAHKLS